MGSSQDTMRIMQDEECPGNSAHGLEVFQVLCTILRSRYVGHDLAIHFEVSIPRLRRQGTTEVISQLSYPFPGQFLVVQGTQL